MHEYYWASIIFRLFFFAVIKSRGRLFKINDIVSKRFVKILNVNSTKTLLFFDGKNAKDSHIFPTKNDSVFD